MAREFQQVGVVGLGTMGAGIAEVFARNGLSVIALDKDEASSPRTSTKRSCNASPSAPIWPNWRRSISSSRRFRNSSV
jgi:3-hydroxyacyl-CoA dehydrogenase